MQTKISFPSLINQKGSIIFICLIYFITSTSVAPTWITNSDIQAATITVCFNNSGYLNASNYYQPYTTAFSTAPNVGVATPSIDITSPPTLMLWKVNLPQSTNQTYIKITMNYVTTGFKTFKIGYIAISGSLTYLKVDYMNLGEAQINSLTTGAGTRVVQSSFNLHITIDSTHTLSIIPYLSGLTISTVSGDFSFALTFAKNNNTNILFNATCEGTSTVTEIVSYILIYDITLGEATQQIFLDYQPLTGTNNVLDSFSLISFNVVNLLAGVSQFKFTTGFSFNLDPSTLVLSIPTVGAAFSSITFSFWSFRKRYCPVVNPYYQRISNLCYSTCPTGFLNVENVDAIKYCESCSTYMSHCTQCTSQTYCTACQTTWNVKSDFTQCICANGYYLSSGSCLSCAASCSTCSGAGSSACLTCPIGSQFSSGTCFTCDASCLTCSGSLNTNCSSCKTTTQYLSATNQCISCPVACLTCSSATVCSTCSDGKYLSALSTCESCDYTCKTCNGASETSCISCDEINRSLSGTSCPCKSGLQDQSGNCINPCTDIGCDLCVNSQSICDQCKASFILSGGKCRCPTSNYYSIANNACYACDNTCAICSGPTSHECTGCLSTLNRQLNSSTFQCNCKSTYYSPNGNLTCIKSPSTQCPSYFIYNSTSTYCDEICGDEKLFQLECDDGNLQSNDGCDSACKIQTGYSCLYGDILSPSICSYDGQVMFVLVDASKSIFKNQIKIQYKLLPELKFFEKFPNFTSSLTISDSSIHFVDAMYSSNTKTLQITVNYNESIADKTITISYTPASSPYSHALLSSSCPWSVSVSNGLSLNNYSDIIYSNAKIFDYLTLGSFIGCLFVYILSLFFRKMIGVQLVVLAQTQVISVSMLKQLHPYLTPFVSQNYIFGYNGLQDTLAMKVYSQPLQIELYSAIGFSQIFGQNFNGMFVLIVFFYLLAIMVGLLSTCKQKGTSKKMKQAALILARQISFGLVLFSLINIVTSYSLQAYSATLWNYDPQYSGTIKIASIIFIVANYAVYAIYFKQSVESYVFYKKKSRLSQLQPLFIATKTILLAVGIAIYHKFGFIIFYCLMSLQGLYIVFIIVLRPFKRIIDFARSIVIELSLLYVIVSRYLLIYYIDLKNPGQWSKYVQYGIPGEYGLVGFSLLMSLVSLIFHLVKANKADSQINPQQYNSQIDMIEQKQKRSTKHSKATTNYPIQDYLQNYLDDSTNIKNGSGKYLKVSKKKNKLFSDLQIRNNSSLAQLINSTDGQGEYSKRKLNERKQQNSFQIIQIED